MSNVCGQKHQAPMLQVFGKTLKLKVSQIWTPFFESTLELLMRDSIKKKLKLKLKVLIKTND
jgi:hypothetical protein